MTQDALLPAPEPIQPALPLAREAPGVGQGTRAIETCTGVVFYARTPTARISTAQPTTSINGGPGGQGLPSAPSCWAA